VVAFVS